MILEVFMEDSIVIRIVLVLLELATMTDRSR